MISAVTNIFFSYKILELLKEVGIIKAQVAVLSEMVEELEKSSSISESIISEVENIQVITYSILITFNSIVL